jgi:hypothetical protein
VYAAWTRDSVGDAGELRFVAAANLHVTLVFRGRDQAAEAEIRSMAFETRPGAKCEEGQWRQEAGSGEWITQENAARLCRQLGADHRHNRLNLAARPHKTAPGGGAPGGATLQEIPAHPIL